MADVRTKSCDVCGVLKKETNHWWQILELRASGSFVVMPMDAEDSIITNQKEQNIRHDCCGTTHMLKRLSELTEGQKHDIASGVRAG